MLNVYGYLPKPSFASMSGCLFTFQGISAKPVYSSLFLKLTSKCLHSVLDDMKREHWDVGQAPSPRSAPAFQQMSPMGARSNSHVIPVDVTPD
jgi:hypothetical protein